MIQVWADINIGNDFKRFPKMVLLATMMLVTRLAWWQNRCCYMPPASMQQLQWLKPHLWNLPGYSKYFLPHKKILTAFHDHKLRSNNSYWWPKHYYLDINNGSQIMIFLWREIRWRPKSCTLRGWILNHCLVRLKYLNFMTRKLFSPLLFSQLQNLYARWNMIRLTVRLKFRNDLDFFCQGIMKISYIFSNNFEI